MAVPRSFVCFISPLVVQETVDPSPPSSIHIGSSVCLYSMVASTQTLCHPVPSLCLWPTSQGYHPYPRAVAVGFESQAFGPVGGEMGISPAGWVGWVACHVRPSSPDLPDTPGLPMGGLGYGWDAAVLSASIMCHVCVYMFYGGNW